MTTPRIRWLQWAAVTAGFLILLTVGLILSGRQDPHPIGKLQSQMAVLPMEAAPLATELAWVPTAETPQPLPPAYSLHFAAELTEGPLDSGYGLLLGKPSHYWVVAVSPTGMASIWEERNGAISAEMPWQPWPHVAGSGINEIWVDVVGSSATVRINRELLWSGEIELPVESGFGVVGINSAGDSSAMITFQPLQLYYE